MYTCIQFSISFKVSTLIISHIQVFVPFQFFNISIFFIQRAKPIQNNCCDNLCFHSYLINIKPFERNNFSIISVIMPISCKYQCELKVNDMILMHTLCFFQKKNRFN